MGLAPVTVANANSRVASPEQSDFFMIFLPSLESCWAVGDLDHARISELVFICAKKPVDVFENSSHWVFSVIPCLAEARRTPH